MIVTDIVEVTKSRSKVFIDGSFAFVLYKGELFRYSLEPDKEITDKVFDEIMTSILPKRAKLRSMKLLQNREYTEKQLRDKLKQDLQRKGISRECIERQWNKLELMGVKGDEEEMIRAILEKKHYSSEQADIKEQRRIYAFLLRRGFSGDMVRKVMNTEN